MSTRTQPMHALAIDPNGIGVTGIVAAAVSAVVGYIGKVWVDRSAARSEVAKQQKIYEAEAEAKQRISQAEAAARERIAAAHLVDAGASQNEANANIAMRMAEGNSSSIKDMISRMGRQEGLIEGLQKEILKIRNEKHEAVQLTNQLRLQNHELTRNTRQLLTQNQQLRVICHQLLKDDGKTDVEIIAMLPAVIGEENHE